MNASIVLDQPGSANFTNLDTISGRVVLRCAKSADVDNILVKLEGESRTRLLAPPGPNGERPKPQLEHHKILYRVQMVFPRVEALEANSHFAKSTHTLPPGTHEYPFNFKIPFNNACSSEKSQLATIGLLGGSIEVAKPATRHVKKTLPPTLSGFPGEAEIRYFVKATVTRHAFFKANSRAFHPFNFFPIEPPRAPSDGSEVFARQKHSFGHFTDGDAKGKAKSLFSKLKEKEPSSPIASDEAPYVSVDARVPEPAILTCNDDVPLRIIVKKLNDCSDRVYLQSLQVSLVGTSKIRAHDIHRTESNSWIIVSKSNIGVPIGTASNAVDTEHIIDDRLWRGQILPNTVCPSFIACNIERSYHLDVRVGLSYVGATKPQTVILPLRLEVQVYSGIAPPQALLNAMAEAKTNIRRTSTSTSIGNKDALDEKLKAERRRPSGPEASGSSAVPNIEAQAPPMYSDAPPSYEDAIASDLPPIDAPRPNYAPPPPGEDDILRGDEKKGFGRRDS